MGIPSPDVRVSSRCPVQYDVAVYYPHPIVHMVSTCHRSPHVVQPHDDIEYSTLCVHVCVCVCAYDYLLTNWESFDILYKDHPHWEKNHCQHSDCDDVHCVSLCVVVVCMLPIIQTYLKLSTPIVNNCRSFLNQLSSPTTAFKTERVTITLTMMRSMFVSLCCLLYVPHYTKYRPNVNPKLR